MATSTCKMTSRPRTTLFTETSPFFPRISFGTAAFSPNSASNPSSLLSSLTHSLYRMSWRRGPPRRRLWTNWTTILLMPKATLHFCRNVSSSAPANPEAKSTHAAESGRRGPCDANSLATRYAFSSIANRTVCMLPPPTPSPVDGGGHGVISTCTEG